MTRYLLDVNVLIALIDPAHIQHNVAHAWFGGTGGKAWATCPVTENGLLRIVGHARYPNSPGAPAAVAKMAKGLLAHPGHEFWPDRISLLESDQIQTMRLLDSAQVTDAYLLALAVSFGGELATFDRRLVTNAVAYGMQALHIID